MVRFIVFILLFILVNSNLNATNIPDSVINFINTELPDFSIVTINDYVQGFIEFLRDKNELPYYCSSDFNGDNKPDHAILLIDSTKRLFLYGLIQEKNNFKKILIDKYDSQVDGIQIIIGVEKKGDWESISEKITVPYDGIYIDLIEESLSWSYYFDGKTFIRFLYD